MPKNKITKINLSNSTIYLVEEDQLMVGNDKFACPFDRNWVYGNMFPIADRLGFCLGGISTATVDALPHKLKYMGFENFEIKKSFFKHDRYHSLSSYIEFYDDAEYSQFCLYFSDLINFDTTKEII